MDKRTDLKTINTIVGALGKMKDDADRYQKIADDKLWKEIQFPVSLETTLERMTKIELDDIRKNHEFEGISNLKKADLIERLTVLLQENYYDSVAFWDSQIYTIVKASVDNSGYIPIKKADMIMIRVLMSYGIAFPASYKNDRVIFVPTELVDLFKKIDKGRLLSIIQRNDEWINLTQGMLYYYGVLPHFTAVDKVSEIQKTEIKPYEFVSVLELASKFHRIIGQWYRGYKFSAVRDATEVFREQGSRPYIDYHPFTKQQLLKAGKPGFVESTEAAVKLSSFLKKYYDIPKSALDAMLRDLNHIINTKTSPTELMDYMQKRLEFPSLEVIQEVANMVMVLNNTTRQWGLKGNTPNEVGKGNKEHFNPLPAQPFEVNKPSSDTKVVDINKVREKKIGRNEPCPCGSGKKYKKCCGN